MPVPGHIEEDELALSDGEGVHEPGVAWFGRCSGHGGVIKKGVEEGGFPDVRAAEEGDLKGGWGLAGEGRGRKGRRGGNPHTSGTLP